MCTIFCLAFSVVESQLVLPSHLGHGSAAALVGLFVVALFVLLFWFGIGFALGLFVLGLLGLGRVNPQAKKKLKLQKLFL